MFDRRTFVGGGLSLFAAGLQGQVIQGFEETFAGELSKMKWEPFSDRKVRVGIAGEGVCSCGSAFAYQTHPNVDVVACTDLDPENTRRDVTAGPLVW